MVVHHFLADRPERTDLVAEFAQMHLVLAVLQLNSGYHGEEVARMARSRSVCGSVGSASYQTLQEVAALGFGAECYTARKLDGDYRTFCH
jgi:hypothetical protein